MFIMKNTALKIFVVAVVLVICGCVFYYVGEHAEPPQVEVSLLSDGTEQWTTWHHISAGLMFMAAPLVIASAMVWSRNRDNK
jgi:hypothetical protein